MSQDSLPSEGGRDCEQATICGDIAGGWIVDQSSDRSDEHVSQRYKAIWAAMTAGMDVGFKPKYISVNPSPVSVPLCLPLTAAGTLLSAVCRERGQYLRVPGRLDQFMRARWVWVSLLALLMRSVRRRCTREHQLSARAQCRPAPPIRGQGPLEDDGREASGRLELRGEAVGRWWPLS